jgi:hypothetical protein
MGISNQFMNEVLYKFTYDVTGGDTATVAAHSLGTLPENFVITNAWIHVLTTFTSAADSATIALGFTGTAGAFDTAVAISDGSNPWDAAAPRVCASGGAEDAAVGNFITAAAGDEILATVAVQALTAGKLLLMVRGYIAD